MILVYALLSAIFAALVAIFAKLGLKNVDSSLATAIRSLFMFLFLVGFVLITGKFNSEHIKNIDSKDWVLIALSGIAGALSWLFYFYAIKLGTKDDLSKVIAIDKLSLVFVAIIAFIVIGERLKWNGILGIVLVIIGSILISLKI